MSQCAWHSERGSPHAASYLLSLPKLVFGLPEAIEYSGEAEAAKTGEGTHMRTQSW